MPERYIPILSAVRQYVQQNEARRRRAQMEKELSARISGRTSPRLPEDMPINGEPYFALYFRHSEIDNGGNRKERIEILYEFAPSAEQALERIRKYIHFAEDWQHISTVEICLDTRERK